ncbi:MAG: hypothetical protein M0R77_00905 [Gammaproteobacteria bacterium]|nr:hypothetical protein [Gammaproteobacteria bacterium]
MIAKEKLNAFVISDIHFGNTRIDNQRMAKALRDVLSDKNPKFQYINAIFFAGDIWDKLLSLNNPDLPEIFNKFLAIFRDCKKKNISVFILEGTKSHEWAQSNVLDSLNTSSGICAQIKYIKELIVWYEERFQKNFLFIPDDLHHDHSIVLAQALEALKEKGLDCVDLAITHGMFKHHVPAGLSIPHHDNSSYEVIVKDGIFNGHVHTHSEVGKVYTQGSFGRISHNEEEAKGYYHFWYDENDVFHKTFIENTLAELFITVDCTGLNAEDSFKKVKALIAEKGEDMTIRIMSEGTNPIFSNMSELIKSFPFTRFSEPKKVKEEVDKETKAVDIKNFTPIVINRENIGQLVLERADKKEDLAQDVRAALIDAIEALR